MVRNELLTLFHKLSVTPIITPLRVCLLKCFWEWWHQNFPRLNMASPDYFTVQPLVNIEKFSFVCQMTRKSSKSSQWRTEERFPLFTETVSWLSRLFATVSLSIDYQWFVETAWRADLLFADCSLAVSQLHLTSISSFISWCHICVLCGSYFLNKVKCWQTKLLTIIEHVPDKFFAHFSVCSVWRNTRTIQDAVEFEIKLPLCPSHILMKWHFSVVSIIF